MEIDRNSLPEDPAALRQMVVALLEELDAKERRLRRVQHLLEQWLRWRYGQKRERVDENQLFLFAAALVSAGKDQATPSVEEDTPPAQPAASTAPAPTRKGHGRQRLPESLQRRRVVFDLGEHQRQCPHCQGELKHIGEEISERLEYVPASFFVIEEACQKYACSKGCTVVTADKPMQPIDKGLPGPGLLAQVAVSKYGDHLPLYRQQQIYQLESKAVQTDDTPVPVLDPALPRTRTGRIWTCVGNHPYTVYDYTPDRSREGPDAFLREFHGFLQADAYSGYDQLYADPQRAIVEVACWARGALWARRKFYEAQSSDLMHSMVLLAYIRLLYDVERQARDRQLSGEDRWALRQARSRPILDDIRAYLEAERPKVLPKSPEGQAMAYTLSNWAALVRYCQDGDLEIDNNGAERSLRGVAVGRKNWMFFGSDHGGRTTAVLNSLIATCKRLPIDPLACLCEVFERISAHPKHRLEKLLPDQWAAARAPSPPDPFLILATRPPKPYGGVHGRDTRIRPRYPASQVPIHAGVPTPRARPT